jgi:hypothetical protein
MFIFFSTLITRGERSLLPKYSKRRSLEILSIGEVVGMIIHHAAQPRSRNGGAAW